MRRVIVYNHSYEGSYCNVMLSVVTNGLRKVNHEIDLMHLDREEFNPRMSTEDLKAFLGHQPIDPQVIDYGERFEKAGHLIFIFPIWWNIIPATTEGFIDKVLSPGVGHRKFDSESNN
jgi:NAD(P)H dehydrogenase (quinone)